MTLEDIKTILGKEFNPIDLERIDREMSAKKARDGAEMFLHQEEGHDCDVKEDLSFERSVGGFWWPWPVDEFEIDKIVDDFGMPWPVDEFKIDKIVGDFGTPWPVDEFKFDDTVGDNETPWPEDKYEDLIPEDIKKIIDYYRKETAEYNRELKNAAGESILPKEAPKKKFWINIIKKKVFLKSVSEDRSENKVNRCL